MRPHYNSTLALTLPVLWRSLLRFLGGPSCSLWTLNTARYCALNGPPYWHPDRQPPLFILAWVPTIHGIPSFPLDTSAMISPPSSPSELSSTPGFSSYESLAPSSSWLLPLSFFSFLERSLTAVKALAVRSHNLLIDDHSVSSLSNSSLPSHSVCVLSSPLLASSLLQLVHLIYHTFSIRSVVRGHVSEK